ncbi:head decoration protein [Reyranella sp.]|uniref:head decoration protein n=1 Tax=Reyranella sp. TaxID=1929291 RepID=UPI003BA8EB2C
METATYDPNGLLAGDKTPLQRAITLLSGQDLERGALLGRVSVGAASSAVKAGGNTGGGTLTLDATTPVLAGAKTGIYAVRCILAPGANGGTFEVTDPDGFVIASDLRVGATFANDIKFAIADVGTDFALGDGFDVTVAAADKYVLSLAAATDGSQVPCAVLAIDCDASAGDKSTTAFFSGEFDAAKMTFGTGHTAASAEAAFRKNNVPIAVRTLP